jgi:hypothetical protein
MWLESTSPRDQSIRPTAFKRRRTSRWIWAAAQKIALFSEGPNQIKEPGRLSRKRGRGLDPHPLGETWARVVLFYLSQSWSEVRPSSRPLKSADALQLKAAFVWCAGQTRNRESVCLDRQLRTAAENVGFTVIP